MERGARSCMEKPVYSTNRLGQSGAAEKKRRKTTDTNENKFYTCLDLLYTFDNDLCFVSIF